MNPILILECVIPPVWAFVTVVLNDDEGANALREKLPRIQAKLQEAEIEEMMDPKAKEKFTKLEDLVYETDDILDKWETAKLQLDHAQDSNDVDAACLVKVRSSTHSFFCVMPKKVIERCKIGLKMEDTNQKIDGELSGNLGEEGSPGDNSGTQLAAVNDDDFLEFLGRSTERDNLVGIVGSEGTNPTEIISIVGPGGVGKTKLARCVFDHPRMSVLFQQKAFVRVSEPFRAATVAGDILRELGQIRSQDHRSELQQMNTVLSKTKFLLVLDNVCTEDWVTWDYFYSGLKESTAGRILVTTRNKMVVRALDATEIPLGTSDKLCEEIVNRIALHRKTDSELKWLRPIVSSIVPKCGGLPVAAISVLATCTSEPEGRRRILRSQIWTHKGSGENESALFSLLKFGYISLSQLDRKRVLYCAVLPKGTIINLDKLIPIWMAYGCMGSNERNDRIEFDHDEAVNIESNGVEFFNNVQKKSGFLEKLESVEQDHFYVPYKMHDIMHEFASYKLASKYNCIIDGGAETAHPKKKAPKISPSNVGKIITSPSPETISSKIS